MDNFNLVRLDAAVRAVCPHIDGVAGDRQVFFTPDASAAERAAATQAAKSYVEISPSPTVPSTISDRQFFQLLAMQGLCTQDEALAAVKTGTVPPTLQALVASLPSDQQFAAEMLLSGATQFVRTHPMVAALGAAYGWKDTQLDAFWTAAAAL